MRIRCIYIRDAQEYAKPYNKSPDAAAPRQREQTAYTTFLKKKPISEKKNPRPIIYTQLTQSTCRCLR